MDHLIIFQLHGTYWVQKSASHLSVHFTVVFFIINKCIISIGQHFTTTKNKNKTPHTMQHVCPAWNPGREECWPHRGELRGGPVWEEAVGAKRQAQPKTISCLRQGLLMFLLR